MPHSVCLLSFFTYPISHPTPIYDLVMLPCLSLGLSRAMLHLKGAKYTNEFVTADDVAANRAAFPFGHVPVLIETKPDGTVFELGESIAIEV